jgi:hypothetical protein
MVSAIHVPADFNFDHFQKFEAGACVVSRLEDACCAIAHRKRLTSGNAFNRSGSTEVECTMHAVRD